MYVLNNDFATRYRYKVVIVGTGGTGGFVAEGLCRVLSSSVPLVLVDPDRVEERNLVRQNFFREDLGKQKSEALAQRLSRKYDRPAAYSILPVSLTPLDFNSLVIGCVDNGPARRDIARKFTEITYGNLPAWWIDSGNDENTGQVLIGNRSLPPQYQSTETGGIFYSLPLPTEQRPELLRQQPAVSCADIPDQGPTINRSMAALVIEVARRLIGGTCPWMQLYLDMNTGTLQPVFATPEITEGLVKARKRVT